MNVDQLGDVGRFKTGSLSETVEPVRVKNCSNLIWLGTLLVVITLVTPISKRFEDPVPEVDCSSPRVYYPLGPVATGICSSGIDDKGLDGLEKAYDKLYGASRQD